LNSSEILVFVLASSALVGALVTAIAMGMIAWRIKIDRQPERRIYRALSKEAAQ
jgi:hypothetical protein